MLLTTVRSYRLEAFRLAAGRLGIEVVTGVDLPDELAAGWPEAIALPFDEPSEAVRRIVEEARKHPVSAILAVDDSGSVLAAEASDRLRLPHNSPGAALAARDKHIMRRLLARSGVRSPVSRRFTTDEDVETLVEQVGFPCVVKPLNLNGSRGVIRADDPMQLQAAVGRLSRLIAADGAPRPFLVEDFVPGREVALEGLLDGGELHVLALFDKPDPLDGPFFEETLYITPSRLPLSVQDDIRATTTAAAAALGLCEGPVHAELRVNDQGAWIVEIAGRSIGGLCSEVLRFGVDGSLEELILRQACGLPLGSLESPGRAAGVMMIPIPEAGILREVGGVEEAQSVDLIERIEITARLDYPLMPLPEGDSYLGFIFARGDTPAAVESALRMAHGRLRLRLDPLLALLPA
jgi:biotin carboxylase